MEPLRLSDTHSSSFRISQHNMKKLSDTDRKTNCCALETICIALALLCGFSAVVFSIVIDPIFVISIIPAIVFTILGISTFADEVKKEAPFVPGQPVGLRNSGNICYINAGIQLLETSPYYRNVMLQKEELAVLREVHNGMGLAQKEHQKIATKADSESVRRWLINERRAELSRFGQEDASVLLRDVLTAARPPLPVNEALIRSKRVEISNPRWEMPWLDVSIASENFEKNFLANFRDHSEYKDEKIEKIEKIEMIREFTEAPSELFLCLKRFNSAPPLFIESKNTTPMVFPKNRRLTLPRGTLRGVQSATYEFDAFVKHRGAFIDGGHYVAYVKKIIDGKESYWECDDSRVQQVSKEKFWEENSSTGHISWMHLTKIDEAVE